jgi:hypothetical protein
MNLGNGVKLARCFVPVRQRRRVLTVRESIAGVVAGFFGGFPGRQAARHPPDHDRDRGNHPPLKLLDCVIGQGYVKVLPVKSLWGKLIPASWHPASIRKPV